LVLVEISSMNMSRCGISRMIGSRSPIQTRRASAVSSVFFEAEAGLPQEPGERGGIDAHAMLRLERGRQLRHRDVGAILDRYRTRKKVDALRRFRSRRRAASQPSAAAGA
jgi:hypothetical protein